MRHHKLLFVGVLLVGTVGTASGQNSSGPHQGGHPSLRPRTFTGGYGNIPVLPGLPANINPYYPLIWFNDFGFYWSPVGGVPYPPSWYLPGPMLPAGYPTLARPPEVPAERPERLQPEARKPAPPPPPPQAKDFDLVPDDFETDAAMHKALRAGNAAFALGNYQTALKHYEQAQTAAPLNPLPAFHIGQVHFALGQYGKAVVALQRGLKWHAKWPESGFSVRALYGDRAAAFQQQLAKLADAVEDNPNDDSLLFLLGYQLWFDGKRDDAVVFFKRASALRVGGVHLDRFLRS